MKPLKYWKIFGYLTRHTLFALMIGIVAGISFILILILVHSNTLIQKYQLQTATHFPC